MVLAVMLTERLGLCARSTTPPHTAIASHPYTRTYTRASGGGLVTSASRAHSAAGLSAAASSDWICDLYRLAEALKLLDVGGADRFARRQHGRLEVGEADLAAARGGGDARLAVEDVLADGELGRALANLVRVRDRVRDRVRVRDRDRVRVRVRVTSVMSAPEKPSVRSASASRSTSSPSGDLRVHDLKIIRREARSGSGR